MGKVRLDLSTRLTRKLQQAKLMYKMSFFFVGFLHTDNYISNIEIGTSISRILESCNEVVFVKF